MFIAPGLPDTRTIHFWRNFEKYICLGFAIFGFGVCLKDAYFLSHEVAAKNHIIGVKRESWFGSNYVDVDDVQLTAFLNGLPQLSLTACLFIMIRKMLLRYSNSLDAQLGYYLLFGIGFLLYIHGPGTIFTLLMILGNYALLRIFIAKKWFPALVWIVNVIFLIITEYNNGYKFGWISSYFEFLDQIPIAIQWNRSSNLLLLKIISFVIDCHWCYLNKPVKPKYKHMERCIECTKEITCLKYRYEQHANIYTLKAFLAYACYPPLYLAGPTLTYNAWISQIQSPQQLYDSKRIAFYTLRLIFAFFLLQWWINNLYFPALAVNPKNKWIWEDFTAYELIAGSYVILQWIWLKFMVIWRFFRLWALLDGIETPENLGKCISNEYCFEGFWRMWHRSFNLWLIRYLFVPLGGTKYKVFNIWVVFGFVALWHDLKMSLLVWGWGMCIFIVPETLVKGYLNRPKFAKFRETLQYNWLCVISASFYLFLLCIANLVGFSFGVTGLVIAANQIVSWEGLFLIIKIFLTFMFLVHFMMMIRYEDLRKGKQEIGF